MVLSKHQRSVYSIPATYNSTRSFQKIEQHFELLYNRFPSASSYKCHPTIHLSFSCSDLEVILERSASESDHATSAEFVYMGKECEQEETASIYMNFLSLSLETHMPARHYQVNIVSSYRY